MNCFEQSIKMKELKKSGSSYPYFIVYFGFEKETSLKDRTFVHRNLREYLNFFNGIHPGYDVYASYIPLTNCFAGQLVNENGKYSTSANQAVRRITEFDAQQMTNILGERDLSTTCKKTNTLRALLEGKKPLKDIAIKQLDFTYLELNTTPNNRSLKIVRGNGTGNCFPLWYGYGLDGWSFSNDPNMLKEFCYEVSEFPIGVSATIDDNSKIRYFDNITGVEFTDASKDNFQRKLIVPAWMKEE